MQNAALSEIFDALANYQELAGENPFKIRAFRRAAEVVSELTEDVEELAESRRLEKIDGLGKGTVTIAREFLATGQVRQLEALKEQFPSGLLDLLRVPGLGPKKVAVLFNEHGISGVDELHAAIANGALASIPGFGPASIKNLQSSLSRLEQMSRRLPLADALEIVHSITPQLEALSGVARVQTTGSVRRGCDTVGNINVLIETDEAAQVLAAIGPLPFAISAETASEQSVTVRARRGIDVVVSCARPAGFAREFFVSTGSKSHVERGLALAAERGIDWVQIQSEEQLFAALGAQFIPPELRENRGEWEAALANRLPKLLELSDMRGDLHAHSTWSDGRHSIRDMAVAALRRGYEYHVISDHSKALAMANGLDANRLREQAEEIAELQADIPGIKILRAVECDIMRDGSMDLDDEILHELDLVIASVHSGFSLDVAKQTARIIKAIEHPAVDIIGHPTGRVLGVRPGYEVNVAALIEAAKATGTALEINSSERLDLCDEHAFAAREAGVLLAINTDAHSIAMLDNMHLGVGTARRAWCEKQHILNTKSTAELLEWLRRPQASA